MFWLTLLPICGGIGASWRYRVDSGCGGLLSCCLTWCTSACAGLAHYAYRMGVAAILPLIKGNTKRSAAASIVGMTVIGGGQPGLNTTLEIKAG